MFFIGAERKTVELFQIAFSGGFYVKESIDFVPRPVFTFYDTCIPVCRYEIMNAIG